MTKSERTRQFIIEQTAPLFNKKGFDGTTMHDLTEATGLTKGAIYGNFTDKEEISFEAFRYSIGKVKSLVKEKIENAPTFRGQLLALLHFYAQYVFQPPVPGGCPLLNRAIETDDHHSSMRRIVLRELVGTVEFIADLFERGIKVREFKKDSDPRKLAYIFFCSIEGALMFSRMEKSSEAMDLIIGHCENILNEISEKPYATKKSSGHRTRRSNTAGKQHP